MKRRIIVLALLCVATFAAHAQADIYIEDGDFELSASGFSTSWTTVGSEVAPDTDSSGNTFALFTEEGRGSESDVTSSLTQGIDNLTSGATYSISFDVHITSEMGFSETDEFDAYFGGQNIYHWDNHDPSVEWDFDKQVIETVTAAATIATLSFTFKSDGLDELLTSVELDNVSMSVVPIPSAALLGSLGLSVAGWRLRRKKQ